MCWPPCLSPPTYSRQPEGASKRQKSDHITCSKPSHSSSLTPGKPDPGGLASLSDVISDIFCHRPCSCHTGLLLLLTSLIPAPASLRLFLPGALFSQILAQLVPLCDPGLGSDVTSEGPALSLPASGGPRGPVPLPRFIFSTALLTLRNCIHLLIYLVSVSPPGSSRRQGPCCLVPQCPQAGGKEHEWTVPFPASPILSVLSPLGCLVCVPLFSSVLIHTFL